MSSKRKMKVGVLMAATMLLTVLAGSAVLAGGKPKPPPGPAYSLAELMVPQGFASSTLLDDVDVNDLGQVVGNMVRATGGYHAAVWETSSAEPTDLDNGFHRSFAGAINNLGQVAGSCSLDETGSTHPVVWIPDGQGGYQMIDLAPDAHGGATDINDHGMVVGGAAEVAFVVVPEDTDGDGKPDTWFRDTNLDGSNDLMFRLGPDVNSEGTEPHAINDFGWVVGNDVTLEWGDMPFLVIPQDANGDGKPDTWFADANGDGVNDLMRHLPFSKDAADVNNQGQIVGSSARLWEVVVAGDGTVTVTTTQLPTPSPFDRWYAGAINDSGQVVGSAQIRKGDLDPVLWQKDKGMFWLESLVSDRAGFSDLDYAYGINEGGQIVGDGDTRAGVRGYLATPK